MSEDVKCELCKHWKATNIRMQGKCQRRSPAMIELGSVGDYINGWEYSAQWPRTKNHDFCGDFARRRKCES